MFPTPSGKVQTQNRATAGEGMDEGLIPGLPDDVAMECLLRVSGSSHSHMRGVCRRWDRLVKSPQFYDQRRQAGILSHYMCMLRALPDDPSAMIVPKFELSKFDPTEGSWEGLPPIPGFPHSLPLFCRCVSVEGKVFVVGGWNPSTYEAMRCIYSFDFSCGQWRRGADMVERRSFFACGVLNGHIYVAGGHDEDKNALATAEVYSPQTDTWQTLPAMSEERDECVGLAMAGKFYVIGGYGTYTQGQFVISADVYDPTTCRWSRKESFLLESVFPSAYAMAAGHVYAFERGEVFQYDCEEESWGVIDRVPCDGKVVACSPCGAGVGGDGAGGEKLIVMVENAEWERGHTRRMYVYKVNKHGHGDWDMFEEKKGLKGGVQSCCTLQV